MSLTNLFGDTTTFTKPNEGNSKFIYKINGSDQPLIVKFLGDPRKKATYVPMNYYTHMVGPNPQTDKRTHPSLRSLGVLDKDPELEVYYDCLRKAKEAREAGDTDVEKAMKAKAELFKPKEGGWIHVIEPNSAEIKCLKIGKDIINQLFGRKAYGDKVPEIKSLLEQWSREGYNPYNINIDEGWVKIYKTGEGMSTRYILQLDSQEETQTDSKGKKFKTVSLVSHTVHEKIRNGDVQLEDFPNPIETESKNAFTPEEAFDFVKSEGTLVPERLMRKGGGESGSVSSSTAELSTPMNFDDIPF